MKEHNIKARGKRKFIVTTDSKHSLPIAPNLLNRNFQPDAPNRVWTSDITYIQTDAGWLYLAVVLDLYSRQVVGWSMQPHMQSSLVTDALKMAWFKRRPEPGLIFHSDRGSQYCSHVFQNTLAEYGMRSSMSRTGNCWDNAPIESLWGSLKVGRLYGMQFETRLQAMDEVIDWLNYITIPAFFYPPTTSCAAPDTMASRRGAVYAQNDSVRHDSWDQSRRS